MYSRLSGNRSLGDEVLDVGFACRESRRGRTILTGGGRWPQSLLSEDLEHLGQLGVSAWVKRTLPYPPPGPFLPLCHLAKFHICHLAKFHIPLSQADPNFLQEGSCDLGLSEPQCVDSLQAQSPRPACVRLLLITFSDVQGAGGGHTTAEVVPGSP